MRLAVLSAVLVLTFLAAPASIDAFTRQSARLDSGMESPSTLAVDCTLESANLCAGWIWTFDDVEGAVWGTILDPRDCSIACTDGGAVDVITLYSRCSTTPGMIGGVGLSRVDAVGCRTALLYQSGPMTVTHCVYGDRWTWIDVPQIHLHGEPFAVTVTWGPQSGGRSNPELATDNGLANHACKLYPDIYVFPGCFTSTSDCSAWVLPPQRTFIYVTDVNGDGTLDDLCALYGAPYSLAFPYVASYGYLPNNLVLSAGLDCFGPFATEPTTWGRVKALLDPGAGAR